MIEFFLDLQFKVISNFLKKDNFLLSNNLFQKVTSF